MSQNPYESPESEPGNPFGGSSREELRNIAKYQKWVIAALGVNVVLYMVLVGLSSADNQLLSGLMGMLFIGVAIATMVAVFLLTQTMFGTGLAVLCTVLMCVPCVSLITLLVVNQKASSRLQQAGIKVGFFGADPSQI